MMLLLCVVGNTVFHSMLTADERHHQEQKICQELRGVENDSLVTIIATCILQGPFRNERS
jgi:hypothetical protein